MGLEDHIAAIDAAVGDATRGLPEPVFGLIGRLTAVVNVDLLIRNDRRETLLTWRHDDLYLGWHIPGGVVRFKERMAERVAAVARMELGATVSAKPEPAAMHEIITHARDARGHFVSFLFECELTSALDEALRYRGGPPQNGQWAWHAACPADMIDSHAVYRRFIDPQP
jgi:ADP-ribose pyrophosphatase YjhB (NUDIX family)